MSIAHRVHEAVIGTVKSIQIGAGFDTNLGLSVFDNAPRLDVENMQDPSCNVISSAEERQENVTIGANTGIQRLQLQYSIVFLTRYSPHDCVADLKRALLTDRTLGGACHDILYSGWVRDDEGYNNVNAWSFDIAVEYDETMGQPG